MKFSQTNQSLSGAVILAILVMSSPSAGESRSKNSDPQPLASGGAPGTGGTLGTGGKRGSGGKASGGTRSGGAYPGVYDSEGMPPNIGGTSTGGVGVSAGGTGGVAIAR